MRLRRNLDTDPRVQDSQPPRTFFNQHISRVQIPVDKIVVQNHLQDRPRAVRREQFLLLYRFVGGVLEDGRACVGAW